jgi:hypothetical protein
MKITKDLDTSVSPVTLCKRSGGSEYTDTVQIHREVSTPDRGAPMDGQIGSGRMSTPKLFRPINTAAKPNVYPHPATKKFWGPV